jgi:hypothetical protein
VIVLCSGLIVQTRIVSSPLAVTNLNSFHVHNVLDESNSPAFQVCHNIDGRDVHIQIGGQLGEFDFLLVRITGARLGDLQLCANLLNLIKSCKMQLFKNTRPAGAPVSTIYIVGGHDPFP